MKKVFIVAATMVMMATGVLAYTETVNGITWTYTVSGGEASIYNDYWASAIPSTTTGAITIPSSLGGYPVTSIGDWAFSGCSGLTSVTIPNSVTSISADAFINCSGSLFDTTTIPGVKLVDGWVIDYTASCPSVLDLTGVRGIGDDAFSGCSGLTSVTIPNSVTSIGYDAFEDCNNIKSVTVGQYICSDGLDVFPSYGSIANVVILDGVTNIGDMAFKGCSGLTSITIPNSVTSIGEKAFYRCSSLTSVTIGNSVTRIEDYAFEYCRGLTSVTIPNSVTSIGWRAFAGCSGLTSVTIPDSVTSIGSWAFEGCDNLTSAVIGQYVCTNKLSQIFPDSYSAIETIEILNGVTMIGDNAFLRCSGLTSITIPNSVANISSNAFVCCSNLTSAVIGQYVCKNKLSQIFPDSYSTIETIEILNGVTMIGDNAFRNCKGLTNITIPDGVTSIGDYAFYGCSGLTSITIPDSVTSIGERAFYGCSYLKSAIFLGDAPRNVGDYIFDHCADDFTIKVKKGAKGWNGDPNSTELPEAWYGYPIEYDSVDDLYPVLDANATVGDVANALAGSVDENLTDNITSVEMYNNYREWAFSVKTPTGEGVAGVEAVMDSSIAWMSFALDQSRLIANEPVEGDVSIASFDVVETDGAFEFTVNINQIDVGDGAVEENLKKLFKIEGTATLGSDENFSSENVEIKLAEPVNGNVKFKILPKDSPDSFFIRATLLK